MKRLVGLAILWSLSVTLAFAQYTFTEITCPGATSIIIRGINDHGDMVGAYTTTDDPNRRALLIRDGQCIALAPDKLGNVYSDAFKINNRGDIIGNFEDEVAQHGFLLRKGEVTVIDYPVVLYTFLSGLNDAGMIAGSFDVFDDEWNWLDEPGFLLFKDNFTEVPKVPGMVLTNAIGLNNRGDFVGQCAADWDDTGCGYVFSQGKFTTFRLGEYGTQPTDINSSGTIVGVVGEDLTSRAFIKKGDNVTIFDYPGAAMTTAWSINSFGQMVGNWYADANGETPAHGWLAQPTGTGKPTSAPVIVAPYASRFPAAQASSGEVHQLSPRAKKLLR